MKTDSPGGQEVELHRRCWIGRGGQNPTGTVRVSGAELGYEASLERRKVYQVLSDPDAVRHRQVRVIDESREDYLYPEGYFVPIKLPQSAERAVLRAI